MKNIKNDIGNKEHGNKHADRGRNTWRICVNGGGGRKSNERKMEK